MPRALATLSLSAGSGLALWLLLEGHDYLVFVFLAPYLIALRTAGLVVAIGNALLYGVGSAVVVLGWLYDYNVDYFVVASLVWIAFVLSFSLSTRFLWRRGWEEYFPLLPAVVWTAHSILLGYSRIGGYWLDLAIFQPTTTPLISTFGGRGVTLLIILTNGLLAASALHRKLAHMVLFAACMLVFGACRFYTLSLEPQGAPITVALLQGAFAGSWEWRQSHAAGEIFNTYRNLSLDASNYGPALIVWPEYALPVDLIRHNASLRRETAQLSGELEAALVVGSLFYDPHTDNHEDGAAVFEDGRLVATYASVRPAFFNENTLPGKGPLRPIEGTHGAGITICYEETQPDIYRRLIVNGARYFVSLSNNQDFGRGAVLAARYARVRAAEHRKYLARATSTGLTQLIDPYGSVAGQIEENSRGYLVGTVLANDDVTMYARLGDTMIVVLLVLAFGLIRGGRCFSPTAASRARP